MPSRGTSTRCGCFSSHKVFPSLAEALLPQWAGPLCRVDAALNNNHPEASGRTVFGQQSRPAHQALPSSHGRWGLGVHREGPQGHVECLERRHDASSPRRCNINAAAADSSRENSMTASREKVTFTTYVSARTLAPPGWILRGHAIADANVKLNLINLVIITRCHPPACPVAYSVDRVTRVSTTLGVASRAWTRALARATRAAAARARSS